MQEGKPIISYPDFDRLIPKARWTTESIKRKAKLEDTLQFLPGGVNRSKWQVAKIAPLLKGKTTEETCYNIWHKLYTAIGYQKDENGKEQIRSPRRTWWDRKADCDDFSVFVSCILSTLDIPHVFRIAMYSVEDGYQHIYVVAFDEDEKEIVVDCVLPRFNKEVPYIKKIDKQMELEFLDGIGEEYQSINGIDAEDLLRGNLGELGKNGKFIKGLKKGLHALNKLNPATVLLRSGILLCMKLNILKIGSSLRYTYLTDAQAKQKGLDMKRFARLKKVREKLEKIFYGAGGQENNLKKAILKGRGNRNKEVPLSGLGEVEMNDYTAQHSTAQILGADIYNSELAGIDEMGSLGIEPTSDTAIATAMSAMTALAALIKSIGSIKPKGGSTSDTADGGTAAPDSSSDTSTSNATTTDSSNGATTPTGGGANTDTPASATGTASTDDSGNADDKKVSKPTADAETGLTKGDDDTDPTGAGDTTTPPKDSLMTKAKDWIKANKVMAGIIGLVLAGSLGYGGYKLATKKKSSPTVSNSQTVSGVPKRRRKKNTSGKHKHGKIKIKKLR